ncbi:MAG: copper chaperone PCu(A)C [Novosphingobium sp.]
MKPALLASLALVVPLAFLTGCGDNKDPAAAITAAKESGELAVTDGKLVLPAVAGNPAAAYFTLANGTKEAVSLAGASVEGATKAEMHETASGSMTSITTLTMGAGSSVTFAPGGKHLMVFGVKKSIKPGDSAKLTLLLAGGKTVTAPLAIVAAGEAGMAGMNH